MQANPSWLTMAAATQKERDFAWLKQWAAGTAPAADDGSRGRQPGVPGARAVLDPVLRGRDGRSAAAPPWRLRWACSLPCVCVRVGGPCCRVPRVWRGWGGERRGGEARSGEQGAAAGCLLATGCGYARLVGGRVRLRYGQAVTLRCALEVISKLSPPPWQHRWTRTLVGPLASDAFLRANKRKSPRPGVA